MEMNGKISYIKWLWWKYFGKRGIYYTVTADNKINNNCQNQTIHNGFGISGRRFINGFGA